MLGQSQGWGTAEKDLALSQQRADLVATRLRDSWVAPEQLDVQALGAAESGLIAGSLCPTRLPTSSAECVSVFGAYPPKAPVSEQRRDDIAPPAVWEATPVNPASAPICFPPGEKALDEARRQRLGILAERMRLHDGFRLSITPPSSSSGPATDAARLEAVRSALVELGTDERRMSKGRRRAAPRCPCPASECVTFAVDEATPPPAQKALARFARDAASSGRVWTLRSPDSSLATDVETTWGRRALPFWSSLSGVKRFIATASGYRASQPNEISLQLFRERWLAGASCDNELIRLNWNGQGTTGDEVHASDVLSGIEQALTRRWKDR